MRASACGLTAGKDAREGFPQRFLRHAGSEGEAKESEVDLRMCPASIAVLAINHLGLLRVQRQMTVGQSLLQNRLQMFQENRSADAQFRQKPLLGKAQSPISFNALEILHRRHLCPSRFQCGWGFSSTSA